MSKLRLLLTAASALLCAAAAPPFTLEGDSSARLLWTRTFASDGDDWINDIVRLGEARYLVVGFLGRVDATASDWRAFTAALNAEGLVLSQREYGAGGGIDAFWTAQVADDGRIVLAGFTTRFGASGIDAWTLIAAPDGAMLNERAFGGAGYDRFTDAARAGDGHVFLGHSQPEGEDRRRLFAVRTDGSGAPIWERIIEGPESHAALYIEAAADAGFVVAGGLGQDGDSDLVVLKLDSEGREQWRRTIGTPGADDVNHGLALLPDGRIVVVGYSQSWGARGNDILAVTLSPAGDILSRQMLGGADDDRPILVKADAHGRAWIVGYTRSAGAGGWDMFVARLDEAGNFEPGVLTLGGPGDDNGTAIHPVEDGSVLVAGYSDGFGGGGQDAFVARISASGFEAPHPAFTRRAIP